MPQDRFLRCLQRRKTADISASPGHWYRDQLDDTVAINGYRLLGEEIRGQTAGRVDAFVHAVGTAHSIHGATKALWAHGAGIHVVAVEPQESAVLSGEPTGSHQIEGIGAVHRPGIRNAAGSLTLHGGGA